MAVWWKEACRAGTPWAQVAATLEAPPGDVYRKTGYSAFGNPELERRLRREGATQLVVVGVKTDLCVESTVRAAFDLGLASFLPVDATAAGSEKNHLEALAVMARGFSGVCAADFIARGVSALKTAPVGRR
jgi:ureidoacrylate peracid hydrolase